jgi:bifunctional enzyme CysN/CysC
MNTAIQQSTFENDATLIAPKQKSLLKFITCGSVDDGKSTLIGRLLFETDSIFSNDLNALKKDSTKYGTVGDDIDFSLLVDGLSSEREQGITIDVAYQYFTTDKRKFIVIDTPGHEQYTRNMATGASNAELAIILVDASNGLLTQTKRHSLIVSLLGVKNIIVAVNKMDLIDYDKSTFSSIASNYQKFACDLNFEQVHILPISALKGDNICKHSEKTAWYRGPTLINLLETTNIPSSQSTNALRLPIQWVNRPDLHFRGYAGTIANGQLKRGQKVCILPSGKKSTVKEIITFDGTLDKAIKNQAITFTLEDDIDVCRGDLITNLDSPCEIARNFQTTLLWMSEKPMVSSRQYLLKCATQTALCRPTRPKYKIDINSGFHTAADKLALNDIGVVEINTDKKIVFEPYEKNKTMGSFILIDRINHETVACGWFNFALTRSNNIHQQSLAIDKTARSEIKGHKPCVIWFTGLSGSGKSTIANAVEAILNAKQVHSILLDGDNIRHGLNNDLGFTEKDRAENIRRIAQVAKLMYEAGLICIVSFISPFSHERKMARELIGNDDFLEIFIDTPLDIAEKRDVKGLYQKARRGEIKNFTGIDSPYEVPQRPSLRIDTTKFSVNQAASAVLNHLIDKKII